MNTPAVVIRELRTALSESFVLGPLSLEIPRGTLCALVGPNGAGKTTLINLLMGAGRADDGYATLLGYDVRTAEVEVKRRTAFVSPDLSYRAWGTVGRAIDFVSAFYPDWDAERCEQLQFKFGLHRGERVDALSFGARVKLSALMALSRNADLLLLDEPTAGLDPLARQLLFTELLRFMQNEERTIIISSHQLAELERVADHVVILNEGRLVANGAIPDLLERYVQLDVALARGQGAPTAGVNTLAREGNRARWLVDRSICTPREFSALGVQVISETALTLEELFVALIKGGSSMRWRPKMVAA